MVNDSIENSEIFKGMSDFIIKHVIADTSRRIDDALVADLNYRTKSFVFGCAKKLGELLVLEYKLI